MGGYILLTGAMSRHYPFRARLHNLIRSKLKDKFKCKILSHPGDPGVHYQQIAGATLERYARELNSAKITLTCSSRYKYRLGKYVEIPMCASLLAADLPDEGHDFFRRFMLVLDPNESDDQIIDKLKYYIKNDKVREDKIQLGMKLNMKYTQEKYAKRFVKVVSEFLGQ